MGKETPLQLPRACGGAELTAKASAGCLLRVAFRTRLPRYPPSSGGRADLAALHGWGKRADCKKLCEGKFEYILKHHASQNTNKLHANFYTRTGDLEWFRVKDALEGWTKYGVVETSTHCYGRPTTVWVHALKAYESISHELCPLLLHGASVRKRRHRGVLLRSRCPPQL